MFGLDQWNFQLRIRLFNNKIRALPLPEFVKLMCHKAGLNVHYKKMMFFVKDFFRKNSINGKIQNIEQRFTRKDYKRYMPFIKNIVDLKLVYCWSYVKIPNWQSDRLGIVSEKQTIISSNEHKNWDVGSTCMYCILSYLMELLIFFNLKL